MFAYHQREWIWKDNKEDVKEYLINNGIVDRAQKDNDEFMVRKFNEYVNSNCPEFRIIHEVCNGTKHLAAVGNIKDTLKRNGVLDGGFCGKSFNTNDLVILDGNNIIIFKEILNSVIKYWEDLFEKLKI